MIWEFISQETVVFILEVLFSNITLYKYLKYKSLINENNQNDPITNQISSFLYVYKL